MKKGTQLLEIYALEIQMYTAQKNNKKLKVSAWNIALLYKWIVSMIRMSCYEFHSLPLCHCKGNIVFIRGLSIVVSSSMLAFWLFEHTGDLVWVTCWLLIFLLLVGIVWTVFTHQVGHSTSTHYGCDTRCVWETCVFCNVVYCQISSGLVYQ